MREHNGLADALLQDPERYIAEGARPPDDRVASSATRWPSSRSYRPPRSSSKARTPRCLSELPIGLGRTHRYVLRSPHRYGHDSRAVPYERAQAAEYVSRRLHEPLLKIDVRPQAELLQE